MSRILELPEPIYEALVEAARSSGVDPAAWIARRLPPGKRTPPTEEARAAAIERLKQHVVSLGHPTGIGTERIDADLARAYLGDAAQFGTTTTVPNWRKC